MPTFMFGKKLPLSSGVDEKAKNFNPFFSSFSACWMAAWSIALSSLAAFPKSAPMSLPLSATSCHWLGRIRLKPSGASVSRDAAVAPGSAVANERGARQRRAAHQRTQGPPTDSLPSHGAPPRRLVLVRGKPQRAAYATARRAPDDRPITSLHERAPHGVVQPNPDARRMS